MRIAVLRNPTSGRGQGSRRWPEIELRLRKLHGHEVVAVETESPDDLASQARRFVADGYDALAVAGGDGTINAALDAVVHSPTALAVLPVGTGNDFARTLGIGTDLDLAVGALAEGRIVAVDVGRWRQGEREGYFLNVAGCGFDAAVADTINRGIRRLKGKAAYLAAIARTLSGYRPGRLTISVDGETVVSEAMLCAVANAQSYGAGLKIAPMADIQDGRLDLVLVDALSRSEFLLNFPKVVQGRHLAHPKVSHRSFQTLTIQSDPPGPFLIDGELLPPGPVEIEVVPGALRIVAPNSYRNAKRSVT